MHINITRRLATHICAKADISKNCSSLVPPSTLLHTCDFASKVYKLKFKMGCGMSTEEKEGKQRNEEIENQLKRDKMLQRNEIKMLLLGMHHYGARYSRPAG